MNSVRPAPIEITHLEMAIVEAVHDQYLLCVCPSYTPPNLDTQLRFRGLLPILQLTRPNVLLDFVTLPEATDKNRTTMVEAKRQEDHIEITVQQTFNEVTASKLPKTMAKSSEFKDRVSFLFNRPSSRPRHIAYEQDTDMLTATFIFTLPIVDPWVKVTKVEPSCIQG